MLLNREIFKTKLSSLEFFLSNILFFLLAVVLSYNLGLSEFNVGFFAIFLMPLLFVKKFRLPILFFLLGISVTFLKLQTLKAPVVEEMAVTKLEGKVEKLMFKKGEQRALLSDISCEDCKYKKLMATFRTQPDLKLGDKLLIEGLLVPLPSKVYPYFYDVEIKNKFQQISGYISVKNYKVTSQSFNPLNPIRTHILNVLEKFKNPNTKSIALALILGDKGLIERQNYESFRKAGLAHILAISGLHMSIACILVFGLFFQLFALTPLALKYQTKKIAGFIGLAFGLVYLLVAGVPISGIRSFLMVFFLFCTFILGSGASGVRSLALALFFILLLWPEEAFFPSFQLSFASVLCLLKCSVFQFRSKILNATLTTAIASILVSIVTTPFALHHFGFVHFYGAFSNIIAIPLLASFVMPVAIASVLLPFEFLVQWFEFGIKLLFKIAGFFADLPFSAIHMPYFNGYLLAVYSFGIIFALCFRAYYRVFGVVLVLAASLIYFIFAKNPYLVVNSEYAVIKDGKNYVSLFYIPEGFLKEVWQEKLGSNLIPFNKAEPKTFECANGVCYSFNKPYFTLIYLNEVQNIPCHDGVLINMASKAHHEDQNFNCNFKKIITLKNLSEKGQTPFVLD